MTITEHVAGPAADTVPLGRFPVTTPIPADFGANTVTLFKPAAKDLDRLPKASREAALAAIEALRQGRAGPMIEPKEREPLLGTYTLRVTPSLRVGFYLSVDEDWHVYWVGEHNYRTAEERFWNNPGYVKYVHPSQHPHWKAASLPVGVEITPSFRYDPSGEKVAEGTAWVIARYHGEFVGALRWDYYADPPVVLDVSVEPAWRRRGVATALWEAAKANESRLTHSDTQTDEGKAWAEKVGAFFMYDVDEPLVDVKPMTGFEEKASFDWINPQIACGGALRRKSDVRILARRGITGIISGRRDFDDAALVDPQQNIKTLYLPTPDDGNPKPTSWFKAAIDFALPILRSGSKVYVHCHAGMNRGPSLAYAVLRAYTGMSHEQAMKAIQSARSIALVGYADDADRALVELGYATQKAKVDVKFFSLTGSLSGVSTEEWTDPVAMLPGERGVRAFLDGVRVGEIVWDTRDGVITHIQVDRKYQRRGVAHDLMDAAREIDPRVRQGVTWEAEQPWARAASLADPYAGWRPTRGMFEPGQPTLDPRAFDVHTEKMRDDVLAGVVSDLDTIMSPKYPDWRDWTTVYLAGSGASYWWTSDTDFDILLGLNRDALAKAYPANAGLTEDTICRALNAYVVAQRPLTATRWYASDSGPWDTTYFYNPGSFDIRTIKPYAAYDLLADDWVVHPPVLDEHWGPDAPVFTLMWPRCEQVAREAIEVLALTDPVARQQAGTALFDMVHVWRHLAYTPAGNGWLDFGNVLYQYLSLRPDGLLRQLYLCKHPEEIVAVAARTTIPEIGKASLPSGSVRLYHVTGETNLDSIRRHGLSVGHAQGSTYGEPNLIWGSTRTDYWRDPAGKIMVEFSVPWSKIVDNFGVPGSPDSNENPSSWNSGNHNIALPFDIPPSQILAIHENWHNAYRYLSNPGSRKRVREGFYDNIGPDYPDEYKALQAIKAEGSATAGLAGDLPEGLTFTVKDGTWQGQFSGKRWLFAYVDGKKVGSLGWYTRDERHWKAGEIVDVAVDEKWRRRGVATWMLAKAREDDPRVRHSDVMTPEGRQWAQKAAAITVEGTPVAMAEVDASAITTTRVVTAFQAHPAGDSWRAMPLAVLTWDRDAHTVEVVFTFPDVRRHGLAKRLWEYAKTLDPQIKHSTDRTPAGTAWAKAVGGEVPKLSNDRRGQRDMDATGSRLMSMLWGFGPEDVVGGHIVQAALTKTAVSVAVEPPSSLDYGPSGYRITERIALHEGTGWHEDADVEKGHAKREESYQRWRKDNPRRKRPDRFRPDNPWVKAGYTYFTSENSTPGTVAFIDLEDTGNRIKIAYAAVRPDMRGRGLGRRLIEETYARHPGSLIYWGKIMSPAMGHLYEEFKRTHPEQTGGGSNYYSSLHTASLPPGYRMTVTEGTRWDVPYLTVLVFPEGSDTPIGALGVYRDKDRRPRHDGDIINVDKVQVYPEHQRKGIATAMYDAVHQHWPGIPVMHSFGPAQSPDARELNKALREKWGPYMHLGRALLLEALNRVDYKKDRPLTGTGAVPLAEYMPHADFHAFEDAPWMLTLDAAMGTSLDDPGYFDKRKAFFKPLPVTSIPVTSHLVVTQPNVNLNRVHEIVQHPERAGSEPIWMVHHQGRYWVLNGHHRLAADWAGGKGGIVCKVWDADTAMRRAAAHLGPDGQTCTPASPYGEARSLHLAAPIAPVPDDLRIRRVTKEHYKDADGLAAYIGDQRVGEIHWSTVGPPQDEVVDIGEVLWVSVPPVYRRRGIARLLWEEAKKVEPRLHHSPLQSGSGKEWAKAVAVKFASEHDTLLLTDGTHALEYAAADGEPLILTAYEGTPDHLLAELRETHPDAVIVPGTTNVADSTWWAGAQHTAGKEEQD